MSSGTENIRRITAEIQSIHYSLASLANEVSHSKVLYTKITDANDSYSTLIGELVHEVKAVSEMKLKV